MKSPIGVVQAIENSAVCLSVGPSVTRQYCIDTANYIIKLFHHLVDSSFRFFPRQALWQYSGSDPRNGGVECKRSMKKRYFLPISRFISEMIQDRAIITMERNAKGTHNRSIE